MTTTPINPNPRNEQLLDTVRASEPSTTRDLAEHLLESGEVHVDSTIGDLGTAVRRYYAQQ